MVRLARALPAVGVLLGAGGAGAHDFWLEPVAAGGATELQLCVGELLAGDARPLRSDRALRADWVTREATVGLRPAPGDELPAIVLPARGAAGVLAYASAASATSLPAERFEPYLRDEGLEAVLAERARRGQRALPGHERYSRAAKALVGPADPALAARALGLRLEIVPEADPRLPQAPALGLALRVLWEERPLAGALVRLLQRAPGATGPGRLVATARTAPDGRAVLELPPGAGLYLATVVHMVAVEDDPIADWESVWASLTFTRRE